MSGLRNRVGKREGPLRAVAVGWLPVLATWRNLYDVDGMDEDVEALKAKRGIIGGGLSKSILSK